jgi:hypothetical protein
MESINAKNIRILRIRKVAILETQMSRRLDNLAIDVLKQVLSCIS